MKTVSTTAKKRKKKIIVTGLAVGVAGIVGYFTWQYFKKKKGGNGADMNKLLKSITANSNDAETPVKQAATPKKKPRVPIRFASQVMLMDFPLKKGSNGDKVQQLQEVLIAKHGPSILPKYGADGDFGTETLNALKKLNLPATITESTFNVLVADVKSTPASLGKDLFNAANAKDFNKVITILKKMKSAEDYTHASKYFKSNRLNGGVRQTIVNGLLNTFTKPDQKEKIKFEFLRIGLQYDGSKWSLSGLDGLPLITREPTMVWINATKGVNVPAKMVLGNEVSRRLDYTLFENKGRYFLVPSNSVTYVN
jgi:peptidoglycan hydrolase-like protein with peptidoglycan-binding domain